MHLVPAWPAIIAVFIVSAFLCRALARRDGRDERIYFFLGLFLGPLALFVALTPLPGRHCGVAVSGEPQLRVVHGRKCPECKKDAGVRSVRCPYCGHSFSDTWWENPEGTIASQR